jgi:hypothetical protein
MATALLITRDDLVRFTAVNGNVDTDKFLQFVKIAQDIHIQNYLGTKLLEKIQADIIAGTLTGNYETLVETYVKPMLIHWSLWLNIFLLQRIQSLTKVSISTHLRTLRT